MKNKRKKFLNKIIYLFFVLFIISAFLNKAVDFNMTEIIKSVATGTNEDEIKDVKLIDGKLTYTGPDIRILEIEPADSFRLTYTINKRVTTGVENITQTINNKEYKVEITHMTMAEFIGKTEQLNGKYDVIVVGRYIDDTLTGPNGSINYKFQEGQSNKNVTWFTDYCYIENDITNKKAEEIREFIQSGQLVYIDKTISDNSNNNPYNNNVDWTKLYYHITNAQGNFVKDNIRSLDNFISDKTISDINITDILNRYINQKNKNLSKQIIYSSSPEGDTFENLGDINKRNMIFNISSKDKKNEELTIKLYLDINGDGLFKEDEVVKTVTKVNLSKGDYKLEYNIYEEYPKFIGYLDWKIEAIKNNTSYAQPIKSYYEGNILFRRLEGEDKRVINVLQISPYKASDGLGGESSAEKGGKLNLKENTKFQKFLQEKQLSDYEINIDIISHNDFYNGNYLGPGKEDLNKSKYDMIIIGFCDSYPEGSISTEAVNQLKEYVATGKSLMLTHDTTLYWEGKNGYNIQNSSIFMKTFRDIIGQSRYLDPNNTSGLDFSGNVITHDPNGIENPSDNDGYMKQAGATFLNRGLAPASTQSIQVYKTNKSLLTSYPFELGDTIRVRRTHGQYLQLNLEDEDVVPIFNLTENNGAYTYNNRYDSRNFYYTYSRGNITFSGTGENKREVAEYPDDEMKLFINTIVKAERSANHKPIISGLSEDKATEVSFNKDFNFNIVVKDPDADKVKINKIIVDGQDISTINNLSSEYKESGTSYALKITKDVLSKYINKEVTINIEAEDENKAIAIKEYKINVVSDAIIVPKTVQRKLVINEYETFIIDLETENDSNPTSITINSNIANPQIEGIFGIESIKPINDNGKLKLEIKNLISYQKEKGREINIKLQYTTGSKDKTVIIKIIYDSDYIRDEIPNIKTELTSEKNIEINEDDSKEIKLEYTITPEYFTNDNLVSQGGKIEEVIFIVDLSIEMRKDDTWNALRNSLSNKIANNEKLSSYKFAAIGYNSEVFVSDINDKNKVQNISIKNIKDVENFNLINPFYGNYNNSKDNFGKSFREDSYFASYRSNNETRNIDNALSLANNIFNKFGEDGKGRAIVLVNTGDVTYSDEVATKIKNKGYKIISIDLSSNNNNNLSELHSDLGGKTSNISSENDFVKFQYSLSEKKFTQSENDMKKVADRLLSEIELNNSLYVTPTFTFDLNDNFEYAKRCSSNITLDTTNTLGNKLSFTLNTPIEYTYSNQQNEKGEYIFTAPEQKISFTIKVKEDKIGDIGFGENSNILDISTYKNYFEYTNFKGTINKKPLETPTIFVEDKMIANNLKHGLYESINSIAENTEDELKENGDTRFKFYSPSKVKFAISFETTSKSIKGVLNIDNKFGEVKKDDIKIYKVNNNKLEEIILSSENIKVLGNNDFEFNIRNINQNKDNIKILIIYDTKINDTNKTFINEFLGKNIKIKSLENDLNVLPDLF